MDKDKLSEEIEVLKKQVTELKQTREQKTNGNSVRQYLKNTFAKTNVLIGILITALISGAILYAASITTQYTFTSGTTISSSQVNANFDDLFNKINSLDSIVDSAHAVFSGFDSKVSVTQSLTDGASYGPNPGYNLFILGYTVGGSFGSSILHVEGQTMLNANLSEDSFYPTPIIVQYGHTYSVSFGLASSFGIFGFEIPTSSSAAIVHQLITDSITYTVPTDKTLYVIRAKNTAGSINYIQLDGQNIYIISVDMALERISTSTVEKTPMKFPGGSTIKALYDGIFISGWVQ